MTDNLQIAYDLVEKCDFSAAIDTFIKTGGPDEAAGLMSLYAQGLYENGQASLILDWLETIGKEKLTSRPSLLLLWGKILTDDYSRHSEALEIFNHAEYIFRESGNKIGEFKSKVWRSVSLRLTGQGSQSLKIIESALENLEDIEDESTLVWATRYRASNYAVVGRIQEALSIFEECLSKFKELHDTYHVGMCLHDMGFCLEKLARIGEAEYCYRTAANTFRELGNNNNLINSLNSLAYLLCLTKQYDQALENLNTCLQIANKIESPFRQAIVLESKADVYKAKRNYLQAIKFYKKSNELAIISQSQYLTTCNNIHIGECYLNLGKLSEALDHTSHAIKISSENGLETQYGEALALQARILMAQGREFAGLYKRSLLHIRGNTLTLCKQKMFLAEGMILHDFKSSSAYELLKDILQFLTDKDTILLLSDVIIDTRLLFEYFLVHPNTNTSIRRQIREILENCSMTQNKPDLCVFALGKPHVLVVNGNLSKHSKLTYRGKVTQYLPEFLTLLISQGAYGLSTNEIGDYLWPGEREKRVRLNIKQLLAALKDNLGYPCIQKLDRNTYRIQKERYFDVSAFLKLFDQLQLGKNDLDDELRFLCRPENNFLDGYKLSKKGNNFRASIKEKINIIWSLERNSA